MSMLLSDIAVDYDGDYVKDATGDLRYYTGADAVGQYIRLALLTQLGTYRFDLGFGSRLYEVIGSTLYTRAQSENMIKVYTLDCLNSIPFIKKVNSITFSYNRLYPNAVIMNLILTVYTDNTYTLVKPIALDMRLG